MLVCFEKKVSWVFQECFNEVLFDELVVAWISSQLPEPKEGLLRIIKQSVFETFAEIIAVSKVM